jgi:hypothetical protein
MMQEKSKLEKLTGEALSKAIETADNDALVNFVTSYHCQEAHEYYERISRGQRLVKKLSPDSADQMIDLPVNVSPEEYYSTRDACTIKWLSMKKRAVDRLLASNSDTVVEMMKNSLGYEMNYFVRERLATKGPALRKLVRADIKEFSVRKLGVSRWPLLRFFRIRNIERLVRDGKASQSFLADFNYFKRIQKIL